MSHLVRKNTFLPDTIRDNVASCLLTTHSIPFILLRTVMDLTDSSLISQAGQMQTNGLPNDILHNLNPIAVMVLLPLLQGVVYPSCRGGTALASAPNVASS